MKLGLNTKVSNVLTVLYAAATLFFRFVVEPSLHNNALISVGIGAFALLFLWALIKSKFLNPTLLGLRDIIQGPRSDEASGL